MSSVTTSTSVERGAFQHARPSFVGLIGGEFFKIARMWSTWITLVLLFGAMSLYYLVSLSVSTMKDQLIANPLLFYYNQMQNNLFVLRVFIGFFLLIMTASVFGREYQLGTIRILLARGVGRLQLLFAKLLTVMLVALGVLALGLLYNLLLEVALIMIKTGSLDSFKVLDGTFWSNTGLYLLTILISMGVTILLAMALTVLGRSLSFGLSAALAWFPADNLLPIFLYLAYKLTNNDFWLNVTAYFLGPNLNALPTAILKGLLPQGVHIQIHTSEPYVPVDATHTLLVALVYALICVAVAVFLTIKRDVKE